MADTWTAISGYTPQDYTDTAVFEVDSDTKKIALITGQALVAGEENSQYIKFLMPRYWDGIDIKDKDFYVEYALAGTYYGKTAAVNGEYNTEQVRFGWIVPKEACCISGTLLFVLRIESTDYVLKTQIAEHPVYKSVNGGDVVPEPTKEAWYRDFAARVEVAIDEAGAALAQAQQAVTSAETAAQNAQTSEENAEMAAAMAQTRYGSPLTAAEADKMIDQNRVYVYIGSEAGYTYGHWYYYNGAAWTDGGVYNGSAVNTDTTLTQSGMAADAKATGDEISELKSGFNDLNTQLSEVASVKNTDADSGIFDLADKQGHVVMRLEDGMIRTCANAVGYHVVTVKPSGGDFSSLRSAVESISDADARLNPYVIEVYEGTYNVLADYTDTEIRASGFSGLIIGDGINIRGIGNRDNIVIRGELSTTDYDSTLRNEVSTLNLVNEMWMENVTVTATNIRYCVHDDLPPTRPYYTRHVKNCKFRIVKATSGTQQKAWGEGSRQGKTTILEDCDFGTCMLWHSDNTGSATRAGKLIVKNCTAMMALINCNNHSVLHQVYLYNNNFALISHSFTDGSTSNKMMQVTGTGKGAMTNAPSDWNYVNGDIERFRTNGTLTLANGQLVIPSTTPYWVSGTLAKATDPITAYGVVVGQDSDFFYVQHSGYINVDRFGFSGLVIGDKITVKSDGTLEVNGTGETFGVVCCVTNDYGTYMRRVA